MGTLHESPSALVGIIYLDAARLKFSNQLHSLDKLSARLNERSGRWTQSTPIPREEAEALISDLSEGAGPDGLYWIAATSVYPELRWPITLRLRDRIGKTQHRPAQIDSDLLRIVQLPWFRSGRMPQWLRARLIDELPAAMAKRVRSVLFEAVGLGSEANRGTQSLDLMRESDFGGSDDKVWVDRLMIRYLIAGQSIPKGLFTIPRELARRIYRRPVRNLVLTGIAGALIASFGSFASLASLPINSCDLLGASPVAPDRMGPLLESEVLRHGGFLETAIAACRRAMEADPKNRRFQYQYARALTIRTELSNGDKQNVLSIQEALAQQNYAPALNELGYHYTEKTSLGVPLDRLKGIEYFNRAYKAGSIEAFGNILNQYDFLGESQPSYWDERKKLLEQYYVEGGASMLLNYAISYRDGTSGFEQDLDRYIEIIREGVRRGCGGCAAELGYLYDEGYADCKSGDSCKNYETANRYYRMAIDRSADSLAARNLALNYRDALGTEQNLDEAFHWAAFAARQGDAEGAKLVVELVSVADAETMKRWGVDRVKILSALRSGADRIDMEGSKTNFLLGIYLENIGESDEALRYFRKSADGGYEPAKDAVKRLE